VAADDANSADWYDVKKILDDKPDFAFDHFSMLEEYIENFHKAKI
jgi:hypothetical protein